MKIMLIGDFNVTVEKKYLENFMNTVYLQESFLMKISGLL